MPYLFRIGEACEASRDRPVGAEQGDDARIADQVQTIARWQAGSDVVAYGRGSSTRSKHW